MATPSAEEPAVTRDEFTSLEQPKLAELAFTLASLVQDLGPHLQPDTNKRIRDIALQGTEVVRIMRNGRETSVEPSLMNRLALVDDTNEEVNAREHALTVETGEGTSTPCQPPSFSSLQLAATLLKKTPYKAGTGNYIEPVLASFETNLTRSPLRADTDHNKVEYLLLHLAGAPSRCVTDLMAQQPNVPYAVVKKALLKRFGAGLSTEALNASYLRAINAFPIRPWTKFQQLVEDRISQSENRMAEKNEELHHILKGKLPAFCTMALEDSWQSHGSSTEHYFGAVGRHPLIVALHTEDKKRGQNNNTRPKKNNTRFSTQQKQMKQFQPPAPDTE